MINLLKLKHPVFGVVWKLEEGMPAQMSSSPLDQGSKLRDNNIVRRKKGVFVRTGLLNLVLMGRAPEDLLTFLLLILHATAAVPREARKLIDTIVNAWKKSCSVR
ncbi:hypothetical protein TNCV_437731 [Trichonephila clavipes]|nr:hypothetical protein TNCV_437731 [Trichonephila clavipes]